MTKLKKALFLGFLLLLGPNLFGQQDLNEYLKIAAENNPGLQVNFNEYMAAMEKVPQVKSLPDPMVAFGYFIQPVETRVGPQEWRFNMAQSFPWFGLLEAMWPLTWQTPNMKCSKTQNQTCSSR